MQAVGVVIDVKSVGVLKMKFVAPMPEQFAITTMQALKVPGELCQKFSAQKLSFSSTLVMKTFDMCLVTLKGNA